MDEDDRMAILRRMLDQQHAIRTVVEAASLQAELAKAANADSLALAIFMLMECLQTYSKELSKFVSRYVGEDT